MFSITFLFHYINLIILISPQDTDGVDNEVNSHTENDEDDEDDDVDDGEYSRALSTLPRTHTLATFFINLRLLQERNSTSKSSLTQQT